MKTDIITINKKSYYVNQDDTSKLKTFVQKLQAKRHSNVSDCVERTNKIIAENLTIKSERIKRQYVIYILDKIGYHKAEIANYFEIDRTSIYPLVANVMNDLQIDKKRNGNLSEKIDKIIQTLKN